jgi:hypothetical protein
MFRGVFKFKLFNRIQSDTFDVAYESNNNLVVSAPTGGGKTVSNSHLVFARPAWLTPITIEFRSSLSLRSCASFGSATRPK